MAYRKLNVNGAQHEYVIGKTHTKVKGVAVFENEKIGEKVNLDTYCECCGESMHRMFGTELRPAIKVTPSDVRTAILAHHSN